MKKIDRIEACRQNGEKGGKAVARIYGKEFCENRAQKGGQTCLERYGREYYKAIRKMGK